ncbi:MAG: hypothetical protein N2314_07775 [Brevinematales bacterium]|nr:hypothetical protein [Brevinematales bacterium]
MKKWSVCFLFFVSIMRGIEVLPLAEIRPGMKGTGYSVFSGWEPTSFAVEIIDVMEGTTPEESLILARLSGQNLEQSGVVAGMSGSPVYINGKLIGAVAYAWSFAKEALCGITPVQIMMQQLGEKNLPPQKAPTPGKKRNLFFSSPLSLWGEGCDEMGILSNRIALPLQFFPLQGRGVAKKDAPKDIRPGDAVAIHLVDGDVRIQAIGTVTAVTNGRVWMFGHPLFQAGTWEAPFSRAYIYTVMPAYTVSFKLGTAGEEIGSVVYDGAFAVEGVLGKKADMIEVTATLIESSKTNRYSYRVIKSPLYQSYFLLSALFALVQTSLGGQEQHVIDITTKAEVLYRNATNTVLLQLSSFWGRDATTFSRLVGELWDFFQNVGGWESEVVQLERVAFTLTKSRVQRRGFVEKAWIDKPSYQGGETIKLSLQLRDDLSHVYRQTFQIPIPAYISSGKYSLVIGDPQGVFRYMENESKMTSDILSYEELLRYYQKRQQWFAPAQQIWCGLLIPVSSLHTEKGELPAFPKRYWEWIETGPNVGRESRRFSFSFLKGDLPFSLFYDVTVLSVTIQTTNTRSSS